MVWHTSSETESKPPAPPPRPQTHLYQLQPLARELSHLVPEVLPDAVGRPGAVPAVQALGGLDEKLVGLLRVGRIREGGGGGVRRRRRRRVAQGLSGMEEGGEERLAQQRLGGSGGEREGATCLRFV